MMAYQNATMGEPTTNELLITESYFTSLPLRLRLPDPGTRLNPLNAIDGYIRSTSPVIKTPTT